VIATGLTREATTAGDGGYIIPLLPPGIYSLVAEASGFSRFEQRGIEVRANVSSTVPIVLELGSATQSVTVEANAELVDTRSGTLGQTVDEQRVSDLPLQGRNAATLVLLAPGTVDLQTVNARGKGDASQSSSYPGIQAISANGSRGDGVNYQLDGGSNLDHYTNVNNPFPNPDALQEFSVQTNNYSAEYGRTYGAVVNIVTKSGTNQIHGSAFEYIRNGAMNARNFFAPVGDKLKRNQFGGTLGGPIIKDKLFFFGTYQGMQLANDAGGNTTFVPTAAQRAGNFSSISQQLVDPATNLPFPGKPDPGQPPRSRSFEATAFDSAAQQSQRVSGVRPPRPRA
jgi:Carboxypeptidase regulatory-like domain